jgi:hypothetical protein
MNRIRSRLLLVLGTLAIQSCVYPDNPYPDHDRDHYEHHGPSDADHYDRDHYDREHHYREYDSGGNYVPPSERQTTVVVPVPVP